MPKKTTGQGFGESLWRLFISIKLTVLILLTIAGTAVIGTLVPLLVWLQVDALLFTGCSTAT